MPTDREAMIIVMVTGIILIAVFIVILTLLY